MFVNQHLLTEIKSIITHAKEKVHQDLGQLQMYVNYFDRIEKQSYENPTIGVLLCAEKNNAVVKFTLPEDNKSIVASMYQLYMPTEEQLITTMEKEMERF